jgi:hypothetical protein
MTGFFLFWAEAFIVSLLATKTVRGILAAAEHSLLQFAP